MHSTVAKSFVRRIMACTLLLVGCHMSRCADADAAEKVWGDAVGGARMSVSVGQKTFVASHPIVLRLVLRNVSENPLFFVVRGDQDFSFTVVDGRGEEIPLTRYGTVVQGQDPISRREVNRLAPGDEAKWAVTINRIHDMTVAGVYVVKVRGTVLNQGGKHSVLSNSLKVVVEAETPALLREGSTRAGSTELYPPR